MGGIDIDLSQAVFAEPELVIRIFTLWGGVDIKIPEGVTVRDHGIGIMGGFDVREQYTDDPNAPVIVIKGVAVMAGVSVRVKRRKELREREREQRDRDRHTDRDRPVEGDDRFRKEL
nr:LiaF domain-containing protein [Streptomyces sp. SID3343]